ncbi:hypothetical protein [Sulfitobacter sp. W074]|uniref:hypothetical protein n=1 Tax=Sulfitobacter sp. W074 TaxID=2867026 RepID=UPI0021A94DF4|nr:hypothetical protein [Sulfitobacter sp. W074]UWR37660.1 hypothetical protein K3762_01035 [Sulfitobacter sp. W074]
MIEKRIEALEKRVEALARLAAQSVQTAEASTEALKGHAELIQTNTLLLLRTQYLELLLVEKGLVASDEISAIEKRARQNAERYGEVIDFPGSGD